MTTQEWDKVKATLKRLQEVQKGAFLDIQLLRNLILDRGWMSEEDLNVLLTHGRNHPANLRRLDEIWETADQKLAQIGLSDWLAEFERQYPRKN